MNLLAWFILLVLAIWAFERFYLRGRSVKEYPVPSDPMQYNASPIPSGLGPEHQQLLKTVRELTLRISAGRRHDNLPAARDAFESISDGGEYSSEFRPVDAGGVASEWVIAPGPTQTVVCYISMVVDSWWAARKATVPSPASFQRSQAVLFWPLITA